MHDSNHDQIQTIIVSLKARTEQRKQSPFFYKKIAETTTQTSTKKLLFKENSHTEGNVGTKRILA